MTLRRGSAALRLGADDTLLDHLDAFGDELRAEMRASTGTQRGLAERVVLLNDVVAALRSQVEELRGQLDQAGTRGSAGYAAGHPSGHLMANPADGRGWGYGPAAPIVPAGASAGREVTWTERPPAQRAPDESYGSDRSPDGHRRADERADRRPRHGWGGQSGRH